MFWVAGCGFPTSEVKIPTLFRKKRERRVGHPGSFFYVPLPEREALCISPSSETATVAVRLPATVGRNATLAKQLAPDVRLAPQVVEIKGKSEGSVRRIGSCLESSA